MTIAAALYACHSTFGLDNDAGGTADAGATCLLLTFLRSGRKSFLRMPICAHILTCLDDVCIFGHIFSPPIFTSKQAIHAVKDFLLLAFLCFFIETHKCI